VPYDDLPALERALSNPHVAGFMVRAALCAAAIECLLFTV
jgi:hypothetical protein